MGTPPSVRHALQSTLTGIAEVQLKLAGVEGSNSNEKELLAQCTDILKSIWEATNAHSQTFALVVPTDK